MFSKLHESPLWSGKKRFARGPHWVGLQNYEDQLCVVRARLLRPDGKELEGGRQRQRQRQRQRNMTGWKPNHLKGPVDTWIGESLSAGPLQRAVERCCSGFASKIVPCQGVGNLNLAPRGNGGGEYPTSVNGAHSQHQYELADVMTLAWSEQAGQKILQHSQPPAPRSSWPLQIIAKTCPCHAHTHNTSKEDLRWHPTLHFRGPQNVADEKKRDRDTKSM